MRRAAFAGVLLATSLAAGGQEPPAAVWFAHATDVQLFEDPAGPLAPEVRAVQEELNRRALRQLFESLASLPGSDVRPAFLVLTGDLGVDPCGTVEGQADALCAPPSGAPVAWHRRAEQVAQLATLLAASPLRDVYLVPGARDVPRQLPTVAALERYHRLLEDVQAELATRRSAVLLHPLTACYADASAPLSGCSADVAATLRLVGFPAWSFANPEAGRRAENQALQEAQMATFRRLLAATAAAGKKAVVASPSAELDDPALQAEARFHRNIPQEPWPAWSPWRVSDALRREWRAAVDGPEVAGVLAGGVHDGHAEIYRPPYAWATASPERPDPARLLLAPPLSVYRQDGSPLSARGFALLRYADGQLHRQLFWYDDARGRFVPEAAAAPSSQPSWTPPALLARLWRLPGDSGELERAAVLAIAFLAAFLTVVQIWKIPPADTASDATKDQKPFVVWLFQGNFGHTVLSGLGGMVAVSFLQPFWQGAKINALAYYLVSFVLFFIPLLLLFTFFQGFKEALRSRLMTERQQWISLPASSAPHLHLISWLGSWGITLHVFLDTFFNYLQGRNQFHTEIFEQEIIRAQNANLAAMRQLCRGIDRAVCHELKKHLQKDPPHETDVRVGVSLLSRDERSAHYVTSERGSLPRPFPQKSFAWLTAYTGRALWWKEGMKEYASGQLVVKKSPELSLLDAETISIKNYFEARGEDYAAFLLLPIPWSRRGLKGYTKGVLHISLKEAEWLDKLWDGLEHEVPDKKSRHPSYAGWESLLKKSPLSDEASSSGELSRWTQRNIDRQQRKQEAETPQIHIRSEELRLVLEQAVAVLSELLCGFNQKLFESRQGVADKGKQEAAA